MYISVKKNFDRPYSTKDWDCPIQGQRFISRLEQFGQTKYVELRYSKYRWLYHPLWQTIVDSHLKRSPMNRKVRLEKKSEFPRVHSLTDTAVKVAAVK